MHTIWFKYVVPFLRFLSCTKFAFSLQFSRWLHSPSLTLPILSMVTQHFVVIAFTFPCVFFASPIRNGEKVSRARNVSLFILCTLPHNSPSVSVFFLFLILFQQYFSMHIIKVFSSVRHVAYKYYYFFAAAISYFVTCFSAESIWNWKWSKTCDEFRVEKHDRNWKKKKNNCEYAGVSIKWKCNRLSPYFRFV